MVTVYKIGNGPNLGFDQAQLVEGHPRELICSGQDAVDANGNSQYPGDMAAQLD